MNRKLDLFYKLHRLLCYYDRDTASYYWRCAENSECITESLLYEMEVSLQDVTQTVITCEL